MKMIIGVLLLGLVACAFGAATPKMPAGCEDVHNKAVSTFNFGEFFKGEWTLTHAKRVSNPNACETFTVNGNKVTFKLGGAQVGCDLKKVENARFTRFDCKIGDKKFSAYLSVLATDYKNYALVYRCGSHEGPTRDNFLVGQRKKSQTFPSGLSSSTLTSKGLKQSDFKKFNC